MNSTQIKTIYGKKGYTLIKKFYTDDKIKEIKENTKTQINTSIN